MTVGPTFNGTDEEKYALLTAVSHNCACVEAETGNTQCSAHKMLLTDQRALDGLVCMRRFQAELVRREFAT